MISGPTASRPTGGNWPRSAATPSNRASPTASFPPRTCSHPRPCRYRKSDGPIRPRACTTRCRGLMAETLKNLGPLTVQAPIAEFWDFAERVWETYRTFATQHGTITHGSRKYLLVRMMYIAEVASNAIRLN